MNTFTAEQHDALARIADFDHVFCVGTAGNVFDPLFPTLYAPEAIDADPLATELDGWALPLTGLTGQYGYSGPWLHDSELIGGAVADRVLSMPGYWVAIYGQHTCDRTPACGDNCDMDIEGWTLAYKPFRA